MGNTIETSEPLPKLLTVREVAQLLRVSRPTAYRWCRTGQVPTLHIGGTLRVPSRALVKTLEAGKSGFRL